MRHPVPPRPENATHASASDVRGVCFVEPLTPERRDRTITVTKDDDAIWHIARSTYNDYLWANCGQVFGLSDACTFFRWDGTGVPTCVRCIAAECGVEED